MGKSHEQRLTSKPRVPGNVGDWQGRHLAAVKAPRGAEVGIVGMVRAWLQYADTHKARFESGIGDDGILGPDWASIGASLRGLLNGECGRLDCGTLDAVLCDTMKAEGFDPDNL